LNINIKAMFITTNTETIATNTHINVVWSITLPPSTFLSGNIPCLRGLSSAISGLIL
jgi:hypothetical protein